MTRWNVPVMIAVLVLALAVVVALSAGVAWADGPSAPAPPKPSNPITEIVGNVSTVGLGVLLSVTVGVVLGLVKLLSWVGR